MDKNFTDYFYPDMAYTYEAVCSTNTNITFTILASFLVGIIIGHYATRRAKAV